MARIGSVTAEAAASRDLIFLNTSTLAQDERLFLYLYSQTPFFNRMLLRSSSQTAQPHLTITLVRHLPTFRAGATLKGKCAKVVRASFAARELAIERLADAEKILTTALGLRDRQPPEPLTYTQLASEALGAGRLDAEYFAPRVRELLGRLSASGRTLRDVAPPRREKFVPAREGEFDYIEISDVQADGTASSTRLAQREAPSRATQFVRAGDVITSTVRPIRRLSALIFPEQSGSVCSSGFVVLKPASVAPEVLFSYLRLPVICELMNLHTSASMYPAISETDLLQLPFPGIDSAAAKKIADAVRTAHTARHHARQLLAAAQRAVEIAIEESEAAAAAFLVAQH